MIIDLFLCLAYRTGFFSLTSVGLAVKIGHFFMKIQHGRLAVTFSLLYWIPLGSLTLQM